MDGHPGRQVDGQMGRWIDESTNGLTSCIGPMLRPLCLNKADTISIWR